MKGAIVGCGGIAQVHGICIRQLREQGEDIRLVAAADNRIEKAEEFVKQYGGNAYGSLEEMLEREEIDVLHICTPHNIHTPMALKALERCISVFLEKPPAITRGQWDALKSGAASVRGKAKVGLCLQNRYNANVSHVKMLLDQGEFGELQGMRGFVTWSRNADYYRASDWRGTLEREGGGVLINQAVHTLDLMQYFCGQHPLTMEAVLDNQHLQGKIQVEDTLAAYFTYPSVRACFYASNSYMTNAPAMVELECSRAKVRIEDQEVTIWKKGGGRPQFQVFENQALPGKSYWGGGHLPCIREFYRCVKSGDTFPMEAELMEDTVWLMLKAYESARGKASL